MDYWEVMRLPIRVFWLFHSNINRILAEKDLRALMITASQTEESASKRQNHLVIEMEGKDITGYSEERDEGGIEDLKMIAAGI